VVEVAALRAGPRRPAAERPVEGDEVDHLRAGADVGQAEFRPVAVDAEAQDADVEAEHGVLVADPQDDVVEAVTAMGLLMRLR
jgi:hypothetical protein